MDWKQYITTDPSILHGAICFVGTRIPVTVVLDNLADGATPAEILSQYPGLRAEHVPAALGYAAELARERVVPIPAWTSREVQALDENLPELVRESLSELGHDAHTFAEEGLSGAQDETVLQACVAEDRILITLDLDFSDIRAYLPGSYPGVWVLRPPKQTFKAIEALVQAGVRLSAVERVRGQLWVIDEKRVRIRDGDAS